MILIWNRKEVYQGVSVQKFNEIRNVLRAHDISYKVKIRDSRSRAGRNKDEEHHAMFSKIYSVYVHRRDYDRIRKYIR